MAGIFLLDSSRRLEWVILYHGTVHCGDEINQGNSGRLEGIDPVAGTTKFGCLGPLNASPGLTPGVSS